MPPEQPQEAPERPLEELEQPEVCANGRLHPGGPTPPEYYKYDMDDSEWFENDCW